MCAGVSHASPSTKCQVGSSWMPSSWPSANIFVYFILAAAAIIWLYLPRPDKVGMAAQTIVAG